MSKSPVRLKGQAGIEMIVKLKNIITKAGQHLQADLVSLK